MSNNKVFIALLVLACCYFSFETLKLNMRIQAIENIAPYQFAANGGSVFLFRPKDGKLWVSNQNTNFKFISIGGKYPSPY
jgi:hypothetical protein